MSQSMVPAKPALAPNFLWEEVVNPSSDAPRRIEMPCLQHAICELCPNTAIFILNGFVLLNNKG